MTTAPELHADAHAVLTRWHTQDLEQSTLRLAYLDHLDHHVDAMWRTCRAGHLTSSALIVDPAAGQVLLTLHPGVGRWLQTGGHCEPDDADLMGAAEREAREESGIAEVSVHPDPLRLDRHRVSCRGDDGERTLLDHLDVQWLALADSRQIPIRSDESLDLRWWPWDGLPDGPTGADASVRALVSAARRRLDR
jgi:8-oxo-dGTP pyrophosphatase MutT (NUDIX family)